MEGARCQADRDCCKGTCQFIPVTHYDGCVPDGKKPDDFTPDKKKKNKH